MKDWYFMGWVNVYFELAIVYKNLGNWGKVIEVFN